MHYWKSLKTKVLSFGAEFVHNIPTYVALYKEYLSSIPAWMHVRNTLLKEAMASQNYLLNFIFLIWINRSLEGENSKACKSNNKIIKMPFMGVISPKVLGLEF